MGLRFNHLVNEEEAFRMNALQLAYLGDCVWETIVRYDLVVRNLKVHHLHEQSIRIVNAAAQARMLESVRQELTEREAEIVRRGRNAHPKHAAPRNQQPEDYAAATAFEALFGYLYISGQDERIARLVRIMKEKEH